MNMDDTMREEIKSTIDGNRVVLFMKGSKSFPQCGFSARVVQILKEVGTEFKDVNVLANPDLRDGLKEYSNWPTFPQLYVAGELVGGCDIVVSLFETGELSKLINPD